MHARFTTVKGSAENIDTAIEQVRSEILPALEAADGFKGFTLHVDRENGIMTGISYFETEDALRASEEAIAPKRNAVAETAGEGAYVDVRVFEVAIDTDA